MNKLKKFWFLLLLIVLIFSTGQQVSAINASITTKEGYDFATQQIGDPWDMSEFSDVSQYLNRSGQADLLSNINVSNNIFSATSITDAQFFPLFPGHAFKTGVTGEIYPIDSEKYQCLYVAMKIDSTYPDWWQVFWFEDEDLNSPDKKWGYSNGQLVKNNSWYLYTLDLGNPANYGDNVSGWIDNATWKGLRIDPTVQSNKNFQVDWVRLTDCQPVYINLSDLPTNQALKFYITIDNREILIKEFSTNTGSYQLDIQGIQPETYQYSVKNSQNNTVTIGELVIGNAPTVRFISPSYTSGDSYGEEITNQWNMDASTDINNLTCATGQFSDNKLLLSTLTGSQQPSNCKNDGISDPKFYLNTPMEVDTNQYRYLSYSMYSSGLWQNVPEGYIIRWVWSIQGTSGYPGHYCHLVSQDIPFDVGWHTYSFDLFDSYNGLVEEKTIECPSGEIHWQSYSPALLLRFDPNENITGETLYQEIDWISLNKMDAVSQGDIYRIKVEYNKKAIEITTKEFYYTNDIKNPTQNFIGSYIFDKDKVSFENNYSVFIPMVFKNYYNEVTGPNQTIFNWNTSGIPKGEYYICTKSIDDYQNSTIFCSPTPLKIQ